MTTYHVKDIDFNQVFVGEELIDFANNVRKSFKDFGAPESDYIETEEEAVEYLRNIDYKVTIHD